jgi:hypothetical protein
MYLIVECRAVSRQRLGNHVPAATDTHATVEVLLEMGWSVPKGYKEANWSNQVTSVRELEGMSQRQLVTNVLR